MAKFFSFFGIWPGFAGEDDAEAGPVHAIDDAHAFGVAVGDKDADGEGVAHADLAESVQCQ